MEEFRIDPAADLVCKIYDSFSLIAPPRINEMLSEVDRRSNALNRLLNKQVPDISDCLEDLDDEFMVRFVHHSTAIEGSTLTLPETQLVIEGEFLPSDSQELKDLFATLGSYQGHCKAMQKIDEGARIDESLIKDIHELTALDIQPRNRGTYRATQVYISNSLTVPAAVDSVRQYMKDLFIAYRRSSLHPLIKIAAFHALFENIHPFRDGNGRCGRIVMNAMLVENGYPPIAIKHENKNEYADALQKWQVYGNPEPLTALVCRCVSKEADHRREAVQKTIDLIPAVSAERAAQMRRNVSARPQSPGLNRVQIRQPQISTSIDGQNTGNMPRTAKRR